jgi:hypothetical protein
MRSIRLVRVAALVASSMPLGLPPAARADIGDPEALRIAAAGHSLKWNWTPPGRVERYGHAETLIHAPLAAVRTRVVDFGHYKDILPGRFKISRVVGHVADGSADVYIQIAVMHEMILLWDVTRFSPARPAYPGFEVVEGRMVPGKGNVQDVDVVWTLHALDDQWTVLKLDLLLKAGLPAPQSAIDDELRDSAWYAVEAMHDRAQGSPGIADLSAGRPL